MSEAARARVLLLRASAAALVEESAEPCWGLAQRLLELAEQMVSESGQPAAYFGNGAEWATIFGERLPECCAACGQWAGQHFGWCIHAEHFEQGEQPEPATSEQPLHYFGCCPKCHQPGQHFFIGPDDWFVCEDHLIAWWVGSGLFSGWQELAPAQHKANRALIERCERIKQPECTCSGEPASRERSPFESDIEWLTQGDADEAEPATSVGELLAWLDLSGLPPVPPVPPEPPARRRQNWRFDGPGEPGEQLPF